MGVLGDRSLRAGAQAAGIIGTGDVMGEGSPIEVIQACFRSDPQRASGTFCQSSDDIITQALGILGIVAIRGEFFRLTRQPVDPCGSHADPQGSRGIHIQSAIVDHITAQAGRIDGVMQIAGKRSAGAIHQIQAIVGRHPEASRPVFIRHRHIVVTQTRGVPGVMQIANKRVGLGIEAIQPAQRGNP
jgi:hypothetical protein